MFVNINKTKKGRTVESEANKEKAETKKKKVGAPM